MSLVFCHYFRDWGGYIIPRKLRVWTKDFITVFCINFLVAMNFYLLMVVISDYAMNRFNSSPSEAGFSASIFIIGALIARLFSGRWITQYGYKKILYAGAVLNLVMTLLYFGANKLVLLIGIRFFHGAAFGITTTAAGTIVAHIVPRERRGEGIGYFGLSQTIATAIGPFIGILLNRYGNFNMIFLACTIASAVSLFISPLLTINQTAEPLTKEQLGEMKKFKFSNYLEARVIPISSICMLVFICYSSVVSFLTVYAQEIHLTDAAGFFFIVYALVILVTRPAAGRLLDLKGEHLIMYSSIIIFTIGMTLFSQVEHGFTLLLSAGLIGFGVGAVQSSTQTISIRITPRHRLGLANSTYFMLCDIGMGIGPILAGLLISLAAYRGMYLGMALISGLCLLLYYLLHGKRAKQAGAGGHQVIE